jgi:hypothetical protein
VPITIELPDLKAQTTFNVTRWTEILADPRLAKLSDRTAAEVWICNLDGSMSFLLGPDHQASTSALCPAFPDRIP